MNIPVLERTVAQKLAVVDCDIHPVQRSNADLHPFLEKRWRDHMATFGPHVRQGLSSQLAYPRMMASGMRADSYPSNGGPPGSDLELMRRQYLDPGGVEFGMLISLSRGGIEERNLEFAAALARAVNDWQIEDWVAQGAAAARRHRHALQEDRDRGGRRRSSGARGDRAFVQVHPRAARRRAARPAPLLADLRGGGASQHSARTASGRLSAAAIRPTGDGLADLLHAGALRVR